MSKGVALQDPALSLASEETLSLHHFVVWPCIPQGRSATAACCVLPEEPAILSSLEEGNSSEKRSARSFTLKPRKESGWAHSIHRGGRAQLREGPVGVKSVCVSRASNTGTSENTDAIQNFQLLNSHRFDVKPRRGSIDMKCPL